MRRLTSALACLALACGCSSPDSGFEDTTTVERSELGASWPLTVDSAVLACHDGAVAIEVDGKFTVIDPETSTRGAPRAFVKIWALDPSQPNGLKDLVPLMEHGRTLCD